MKLHTKKNGSLYKNLKLQTKFTITHLVIATIPMIVLAIFFYTKLYDMIIADTIRTEQNASTQTAPLIEDAVSRILRLHDQITGEEFYHQIVSSARTETLSGLADGDSADIFLETIKEATDGSLITDVKLYIDIPRTDRIFSNYPMCNTILPINNAWGTYWYGIFNGAPSLRTLFRLSILALMRSGITGKWHT